MVRRCCDTAMALQGGLNFLASADTTVVCDGYVTVTPILSVWKNDCFEFAASLLIDSETVIIRWS